MYILPPLMDEVLSEEIVKTINEMGGNIPGGNFPGGSLMGENFPRTLSSNMFVTRNCNQFSSCSCHTAQYVENKVLRFI